MVLGAADAVAQDAEEDAARSPTHHEDHGGVAGVLGYLAGGCGVGRVRAQQFHDGRAPSKV